MIIGGIIAEYNPFHNGHLYQLNELKKHCDGIAVVMSGSFVQRGDAAITDKFTRAAAAVQFGANLVVELPAVYALSSAPQFAFGGVSILKLLGCGILCFGSECGDAEALINAAGILTGETREQSQRLRSLLKKGNSYPAAVSEVFELSENIFSSPNDILAAEYIKAARKINYFPKFLPLKRHGAMHDSDCCSESVASASHIRSLILSGKDYKRFIPDYEINDIRSISELNTAVISAARIFGREFFSECDLPESTKNRLFSAAPLCSDIEALAASAKEKAVTLARIRRSILCAFLGIDKYMCRRPPEYIRVLALDKTGAEILKYVSGTHIIVKAADYKAENECFKKDILSSDIAALCGKIKKGGSDFTTSPAFIKRTV